MTKLVGFAVIVAGVLLAGCASEPEEAAPVETPRAAANIEAKSGSDVVGTAEFSTNDGQVTVRVEIQNAPPGEHAVHLHDIGDCSSDDGKSAGGHWNPGADDHGKWNEAPFHLGDVGNLRIDEHGHGSIDLTTDLWSIGTGVDNDVTGHAIVVHAGADDFVSQPTGAAGGRIGCGVIE